MLFISGATGKVGSELVRELRKRDVAFRAGVHKATVMSGQLSVEFDWDRTETYQAALAGCEAAFLLTPATPKVVEYTRHFIRVAQEEGVRRVVKMSVIGAQPDGITLQRQHAAAETLLRESSVSWSILRSAPFMQGFPLHYGASMREERTLYLPHGAGEAAWVDTADVAAVAAHLLMTPACDGQVYDVTGPQALSTERVARVLSEVWGHRQSYVAVPEEAARQGMLQRGLPAPAVEVLLEVHGLIREGRLAQVMDTVNRLLGRDARTLEQFARSLAC